MKPGKVGTALVVCALSGVVFVQTMKLTEIPKLEDRVDELTVQNAQLEQDLGITQSELTKRAEAYKALETQKEQLSTELEEKTVQVEVLEADVYKLQGEKQALESEIERLKKSKAVSTASGDFEEVKTVGTNFQVTWYNDFGHTASGRFVKDGVTLSVDPNVIPLGSWVKLTFPNGKTLIRRADDTGGAVNGHIVDVYANVSTSELYQRGRTHGVTVTLLRKK